MTTHAAPSSTLADMPLAGGLEGPLRLDDQLCFALYAATNEVLRAYRPLLAQLGLTYAQYILLMALWEHGCQTVSQLALTLRLPAHGLLPIITRLQQADFVTRRRDASDRRVVWVTLTPDGAALEQQAARVQRQVRCRTQLSNPALLDLRDQLTRLMDDLTTAQQDH